MTLEQCKRKMLAYRDFWGGPMPYEDEIKAANSKKELADIIWKFNDCIADQVSDAQSSLHRFEKTLGLETMHN